MNLRDRWRRERAMGTEYPGARAEWARRLWREPLRRARFTFGGVSYRYFIHPYNHTWRNERAVEIPIARRFLAGTAPRDLLEVGNVLSHYTALRHTVVDRTERCPYRPVHNVDFVDYDPGRTFRAIVSLSTIEHVGWDETPRRPERVRDAFARLRSLLAPGGRALVTIPVGYNPFLDDELRRGAVPAASLRGLRRVNADNEWRETGLAEALACRYADPFPCANGLVFVECSAD